MVDNKRKVQRMEFLAAFILTRKLTCHCRVFKAMKWTLAFDEEERKKFGDLELMERYYNEYARVVDKMLYRQRHRALVNFLFITHHRLWQIIFAPYDILIVEPEKDEKELKRRMILPSKLHLK